MKHNRLHPCAVARALALLCGSALAQPAAEPDMLAKLQQAYPGTRFTSVERAPIQGLFEVWMGPNVAYVSAGDMRHFIVGRVIDMQTMTDLTGPKLVQAERTTTSSAARAVDFDTLPLADAIKTVRGDGSRRLVVFSDPGCGYCRRLEAELAHVSDVTVHTFLVPFQGTELPDAISCSADPGHAYAQVMAGGAAPKHAATPCDSPVGRNLRLARQLGIHGTPTILFDDGGRSDGYLDRRELRQRLAAAATAAMRQGAAAESSSKAARAATEAQP